MNESPGIEAVMTLVKIGYRFTVNGDSINAKYHGPGKPDPAQVRPLLETVKAHKPEAIYFLRSYCPKCGGCCFIGSLCMACDWQELTEIYPDLKVKQ